MSIWSNDDSSSFQVRETTPPHKGGLADTDDTISKYFLNHDTNTPYAKRQGSMVDSLLGIFNRRDNGFAAATKRPSTYVPPYSEDRCLTTSLSKFALNIDKNNPYQN